MTKHGLRRVIIIAAVLCLFSVLFISLDFTGQADLIQAAEKIQLSADQLDSVSQSDSPAPSDSAGSSDSADKPGSFSTETANSPVSTLQCIHYTEKEFFKSVTAAAANSKAQSTYDSGDSGVPASAGDSASTTDPDSADTADTSAPDNNGRIAGGVVPHHLLAANMIAEFFQTLSEEPPETLIVIAPNHRRIGLKGLHTSRLDWRTAFGMLEANRELASGLIDELGSSENNSLMELEHSISGLVPYIKYYLPDTKIVPILLHGNYSAADSKKLGKYLAAAVKDNPDIMVIASIDFSHYLDTYTADRMDEITLKAIKMRNTEAIIRMGNDNIDSPPSILALLAVMDEIGAAGPLVTGHSNSYAITGDGADYTTSYFTMLFRQQLEE